MRPVHAVTLLLLLLLRLAPPTSSDLPTDARCWSMLDNITSLETPKATPLLLILLNYLRNKVAVRYSLTGMASLRPSQRLAPAAAQCAAECRQWQGDIATPIRAPCAGAIVYQRVPAGRWNKMGALLARLARRIDAAIGQTDGLEGVTRAFNCFHARQRDAFCLIEDKTYNDALCYCEPIEGSSRRGRLCSGCASGCAPEVPHPCRFGLLPARVGLCAPLGQANASDPFEQDDDVDTEAQQEEEGYDGDDGGGVLEAAPVVAWGGVWILLLMGGVGQ